MKAVRERGQDLDSCGAESKPKIGRLSYGLENPVSEELIAEVMSQVKLERDVSTRSPECCTEHALMTMALRREEGVTMFVRRLKAVGLRLIGFVLGPDTHHVALKIPAPEEDPRSVGWPCCFGAHLPGKEKGNQ